jgi:hypothetical protein
MIPAQILERGSKLLQLWFKTDSGMESGSTTAAHGSMAQQGVHSERGTHAQEQGSSVGVVGHSDSKQARPQQKIF